MHDVDDNARSISAAVGGFIEQVGLFWHPLNGGVSMLCDENGREKQLPLNFHFHLRPYDKDGLLKGRLPVVGPALFVRYNAEGDLVDILDANVALIQECIQR